MSRPIDPSARSADEGAEIIDLSRYRAARASLSLRTDTRVKVDRLVEAAVCAEDLDPEGARRRYERALRLDPDCFDAHLNLGRLFHLHGVHDAAEAHYARAITLDPLCPVARFNAALLCEDKGDLPAARAGYERVLTLDPDFADAHHNLSLLERRLSLPGPRGPAGGSPRLRAVRRLP